MRPPPGHETSVAYSNGDGPSLWHRQNGSTGATCNNAGAKSMRTTGAIFSQSRVLLYSPAYYRFSQIISSPDEFRGTSIPLSLSFCFSVHVRVCICAACVCLSVCLLHGLHNILDCSRRRSDSCPRFKLCTLAGSGWVDLQGNSRPGVPLWPPQKPSSANAAAVASSIMGWAPDCHLPPPWVSGVDASQIRSRSHSQLRSHSVRGQPAAQLQSTALDSVLAQGCSLPSPQQQQDPSQQPSKLKPTRSEGNKRDSNIKGGSKLKEAARQQQGQPQQHSACEAGPTIASHPLGLLGTAPAAPDAQGISESILISLGAAPAAAAPLFMPPSIPENR